MAGGPIVQVSVFGMADDLNIVYNEDGSVKKYIKSVFGASSPEYKQVSGLKFKLVKD